MATYGYRCTQDGPFDVTAPIGTAPAEPRCPRCGGAGRRVWTAPRLSTADRRRMALIDATKATADRPAVVDSPPPPRTTSRRTVSASTNPMLARLPRP